MNIRTAILLMSLSLSGTLIIYVMSVLAAEDKHGRNGFTRNLRKHILIQTDTLDIKYDSYYIAGNTKHTLYLGNRVAHGHILAVNMKSMDRQTIEFKLSEPKNLLSSSIQITVDSPYFYLNEGTAPVIYQGELNKLEAHPKNLYNLYFLDAIPTGNSSFILRALNHSKENVLGRLELHPFKVEFPASNLKKQIDGFFCTHGQMLYNKDLKRLIYVYTYRNKYLVMDSALRLILTGRTIDTVSRAKIKVAEVSSDNSLTLAAPPLRVNGQSSATENLLFVNSALMGDNETYKEFDHSSVIDIYDLKHGKYQSSFYIPDYDGERLKDFILFKHNLIALYKTKIIKYSILMDNLH